MWKRASASASHNSRDALVTRRSVPVKILIIVASLNLVALPNNTAKYFPTCLKNVLTCAALVKLLCLKSSEKINELYKAF